MKTESPRGRRPLVAVLVGTMVGLAPLLAAIGGLGGLQSRNNGENKNAVAVSPNALLSVRRLNETLARDVAVNSLRRDLKDYVSSIGNGSCLSVRAGERTVVERNGTVKLIPASNTKILTALVALDVLGADHRFTTKIVGEVVDGVATGNLYIVGGGDPVLSLPNYPGTEQYPTLFFTDVTSLLNGVASAGVRRVEGSLVGDGTLFDEQRFPSGWSDDIRYVYGGPIGALLLDDGTVFGLGQKPDDPAYAASQELSARLRNLGISVIGSAAMGKAPPDSPVVASIESAPLSDIVTEMLTNSDNNTAEMLLKSIGLASKGVASTAAGAQVVMDKLIEWGFSTDGLTMNDGSGLDRSNQLTCDLLVGLLETPEGHDLAKRMAIGGTTGTLVDAFTEPPAYGVVRAKTGSLTGVKALSGFASDAVGAPVFSLIFNGSGVNNSSYFRPRWTELLSLLYGYPQAPSADKLDLQVATDK